MVWLNSVRPGQLLAQTKCRIENRVAGRVSKHPELIMLADLRIGLKSIDCRHPGPWCGEKAVHENQGNSIGIVRLQEIQPDLCGVVPGFEATDQSHKGQIPWWLVVADR